MRPSHLAESFSYTAYEFASVSGMTPEKFPSVQNQNSMSKTISPKNPSPAAPPATKLAYTRDEAAAQLGLHPITISRLTERGLLRPSRATRRPLYSDEELKRFLRDTATQPVKP